MPSAHSAFPGAAVIGVPAAAAPARQMIVLARPSAVVAWWLDPVRVIVLIVLPLFCFAAYQNKFNYWQFNASADFVTTATFGLGLYGAALLVVGIALARLALPPREMVTLFEPDRAERVLMRIGWTCIAAYVILYGTLLAHADLVINLLHGDVSAGTEIREALGRVPGVTSLVQLGLTYLAILSALVTLTSFRLTSRLRTMGLAILALTFMRSILGSERLALLEALAALFITPIAFRWRPSILRSVAPFVGIVFVFAMFAFGEYFRSWQYYRQFYDSYVVFVSQRFAGYFSTSINNGAGAYTYFGSKHPVPQLTTGWITRFPGLKGFFGSGDQTVFEKFLSEYSTLEFNNPGGFYSAFLDYGFVTASAFMLFVGMAIGVVYRKFRDGALIGLALYPLVFLGLTDLIRILYIADTRTLPIFVGAVVAWYAIRPVTVPRARLLASLSSSQPVA